MTRTGIYVHFPFCKRKCPYCAFYSVADRGLEARYMKAIEADILAHAEPGLSCATVYFGGGTPSLMRPDGFKALLDALRESFTVDRNAEVSIEANPGTVTGRSLAAFRKAGANRIVFGVQSFSGRDLEFLGRIHGAAESRTCVGLARRAGFENVGIDLIYGLPGMTLDSWNLQMEAAAGLRPDHISCYSLTKEPGTPLAAMIDAGSARMASDEEAREAFLFTHKRMAELGFPFYEVSNFARAPRLRCLHNLGYWDGRQYRGFGPSAHSFDGRRRSWNAASAADYVAAIEAGLPPPGGGEDLTDAQLASERVMLALRTAEGLDMEKLEASFAPGFRARNSAVVGRMVGDGLAREEEPMLILTAEGLAVADAIAARLEC